MKQYKGDLEGFPSEVVDRILDEQVRQGNERDVSVFEHSKWNDIAFQGFYWIDSVEGYDFWNQVIGRKNFDLFFERYPRKDVEVPFPTLNSIERTKMIERFKEKRNEIREKLVNEVYLNFIRKISEDCKDGDRDCIKVTLSADNNVEDECNDKYKSWSDEISDSVDWNVNVKDNEAELEIQLIPKCKIIYAQGKEVVFDLDNFTIENNMLIIKAK